MGFLDNLFKKKDTPAPSSTAPTPAPTPIATPQPAHTPPPPPMPSAPPKMVDMKVSNISEFWNWFGQNEAAFKRIVFENGNVQQDFLGAVVGKLQLLQNGIWLLAGVAEGPIIELVLTAEGMVKLFPVIDTIIAAAPQIPGWKFTALKPAVPNVGWNIKMGNYEFSAEKLNFYVNEHDSMPDLIDIAVFYDDFNASENDLMHNGVFMYIDNLLGEREFATIIDGISVGSRQNAQKELIPISNLKDYLSTRQKQFVDKYQGFSRNTEDDQYIGLEGRTPNGSPVLANINQNLINWDTKASHPWLMKVTCTFKTPVTNGGLDAQTSEFLDEIEEEICTKLPDVEGYLNFGRVTVENIRELFFACREYSHLSTVMHHIQKSNKRPITIEFEVQKDKYWRLFDQFRPSA